MQASFMRAIIATLLTVFAAGPAFASAGTPLPARLEETAPAAPAAAPVPTRAAAADTDSQRYASRERTAAPGLEQFNGGDGFGIYIGTGALLVALLVVVAIVLL
jgi:hypothetical protein